jgi:hypothetical protein
MKKIIAICGKAGSGKDTIANYLINNHNFKKESFAASLKDAVSAVFDWNRHLLEGDTTASREWRESINQWWADRLNIPHLTPRWVLQNWGTEVLRTGFHDDLWIASLEHRLSFSNQISNNIVISDCRFPNEFAMIKKLNGIVIKVERDNVLSVSDHVSEHAWNDFNFDYTIDNNGSLSELYKQVNPLI